MTSGLRRCVVLLICTDNSQEPFPFIRVEAPTFKSYDFSELRDLKMLRETIF